MKTVFSPQISIAKRTSAGLLAVWMSGIVFLLCCGAMPEAKAAEVESCPLAKKGHCAKSAGDENAVQFVSFQNADSVFDCCGFLPQVFDKARKIERNQLTADVPVKPEIKSPLLVSIKVQPNAFFAYRPRPLNRSGTYLKNQVFRI